ncbi:translocon at inner membrane of chloroplasts 21 [Tasmannia lanceolata]|uniref:translocon at inner membrane of chloroplasts 21 n=1 Tax=Tasmannia lanceolata TaxID=3420 RepID=UPI00406286B4
MQMLLPSIRSNGVTLVLPPHPPLYSLPRFLPPNTTLKTPLLPLPISSITLQPISNSIYLPSLPLSHALRKNTIAQASFPTAYPTPNEDGEKAKLQLVSKRLENTARYFKRLGTLGFWGQLVCTVVAAVILSFSTVVTGKITAPVTFYATAAGIAAAFVSVFWSFGYIRLSDKLRRTANEPAKAPPRAEVVKSLKNGIVLNVLGMGAAILGMQATVGLLVAKALTSSAVPYYQGISPGYAPVLALDVFLVQASANTILSHFLGLLFSLELLRSVTLTPSEGVPIPRAA